MNWMIKDWLWELDGWIIVTGILCSVSAALLGNFLILRRMSLLGDAISHAVLPGLAAAFLLTGSRNSVPMFLGAVFVGVLTAIFTQWIRSAARVDEGASMGVVFTTLFAIGLIMIVRAADRVDLDPGCVLYGAIEFTPLDTLNVLGCSVPRVAVTQGIVLIVNAVFVSAFFKELKLSSFDPALATTLGFNASLMHYLLMTLVAVTSVASFESVGNILVVAMFVVPGAAALLVTDRLATMIQLSALFAAAGAIGGHVMAITVPGWFGCRSTSTAGMMALAIGLIFTAAALFAPLHGWLPKWLRRRSVARNILSEDIIAWLYRLEERGEPASVSIRSLRESLLASHWMTRRVIGAEERAGRLHVSDHGISLTDQGRSRARELVRSHRLWESYLAKELDLPADRIHDKAEKLEHVTDRDLRTRLDEATAASGRDPHGSLIPPEDEEA